MSEKILAKSIGDGPVRLVASRITGELFVGAEIVGRGFWTFRKRDYPDMALLHDALAMLVGVEPEQGPPERSEDPA